MADRAYRGCAIAENSGVEVNREPFGKRVAGRRPLKANDGPPAAVAGDGCEVFELRSHIVSKGLIFQNVRHGEPLAGANAYGAHALAVDQFGPARQDGDKNLFHDDGDDLGLAKDAYNLLGGLIEHAAEICSITNPTINSYKRINAPVTSSGATWAPNTVTFAGNKHTHMVRAPSSGRFEFWLADGATNTYLLPATVLACGLDGTAKKADPGKLPRERFTTPRRH